MRRKQKRVKEDGDGTREKRGKEKKDNTKRRVGSGCFFPQSGTTRMRELCQRMRGCPEQEEIEGKNVDEVDSTAVRRRPMCVLFFRLGRSLGRRVPQFFMEACVAMEHREVRDGGGPRKKINGKKTLGRHDWVPLHNRISADGGGSFWRAVAPLHTNPQLPQQRSFLLVSQARGRSNAVSNLGRTSFFQHALYFCHWLGIEMQINYGAISVIVCPFEPVCLSTGTLSPTEHRYSRLLVSQFQLPLRSQKNTTNSGKRHSIAILVLIVAYRHPVHVYAMCFFCTRWLPK